MAADWCHLPPDLLRMIAQNLNIYIDYLHFRAVCVNWNSSVPKKPLHLPRQLPWLMLYNKRGRETFRGFFSLSDDKIHWLELPEAPRHKRFCGSSEGWLVVLEETPSITLLNPLTRAKIHLPPISTFPIVSDFDISQVGREYQLETSSGHRYTRNLIEMRDGFMKKLIVGCTGTSIDDDDADYVILAILNETDDLVFCKRGDKSWSLIADAQSYCEDVIWFKGSFYAVDRFGRIAICDVIIGDNDNNNNNNNSNSPVVVVVKLIETPRVIGGDILYLVEVSGELFLVMRVLELKPCDLVYKTTRFEVLKFDSRGSIWSKVENLGDYALFLGKNSSLSVLASQFMGCRANCIYFTDDYSEANYEGLRGDHDLGIFNLVDGSMELLPCYSQHSRLIWPTPLWVSPNPL